MHRRLIRVMRGSAAALLLLASATTAQAQDRIQDDPLALSLKEKAAPTLGRTAAVIDRAVAFLDLSNLEIETYNYGPVTGEEFGSSYTFANSNGTRFNYVWDNHFIFGVEAGPTISTGIVHDTYYHNAARHDWEARDGSRGTLMADPPQTTSGNFPMFAHSDLPATMPPSGWPAPSVTETWLGTETWDKWAVAGDRSTYAEFDDSYAFREDPTQSEPLGIEVRVRAVAYASLNVIFFQYEIENTSSNTYTGVYLGNIVDSGGPTTWYWAEASMVYDESMGMIYPRQSEGAGYDPGSGTMTGGGSTPLGFVAHMFLESPSGDFKKDGTGTYVNNPQDVLSRVALFAYPDFTDPTIYSEDEFYGAVAADIPRMGNTQANNIWKVADNGGVPILEQTQADMLLRYTDEEDPMFYAGTGPYTMAPGEKFDYVIAAVGGFDEAGLYAEAQKAITTYNAKFAGPGPPRPPSGFVANGVLAGPEGRDFNPVQHAYRTYYTPSGDITLSFDLSRSLNTPDALSGIQDFEGIRIYRSSDRGSTWGARNYDSKGNPDGWFPYAQFDLENGITGEDAFTNTNLGDDTGLVTTWTDPNVLDGIEYWYAITVYDRGEYDPVTDEQVLQSLETPIGSNPNNPTVLAAMAGARPSGYVSGGLGTATERASSISLLHEGETREHKSAVWVEVRSEPALTGDEYELSFTDFFVDPQGDTTSTELLTGGWGSEHTAAGATLTNTTTSTTLFEALEPGRENLDWANLPVTDGMRIFVRDPNDGNYGVHQVGIPGDSGWSLYTAFAGPKGVAGQPDMSLERAIANDAVWDFQVVWSDTASDGSTNQGIAAFDAVVVDVPIELYRMDTGERVWPVITDWFGPDIDWDHGWERVIVTNVPYDTDFFDTGLYPNHDPADPDYWDWWDENNLDTQTDWIWFWEANQSNPDTWYPGETWTVETYRPIASDAAGGTGSLAFSTTASGIDQAAADLDDVVVVPNPYYIFAEWDQNENNRKIQFRNVPPNSTVDVYTLSGELIASLEHGDAYSSDKIGTVEWNIWTYEFTEAAYGLYIYVVKTANGQKKVGKFAIIR